MELGSGQGLMWSSPVYSCSITTPEIESHPEKAVVSDHTANSRRLRKELDIAVDAVAGLRTPRALKDTENFESTRLGRNVYNGGQRTFQRSTHCFGKGGRSCKKKRLLYRRQHLIIHFGNSISKGFASLKPVRRTVSVHQPIYVHHKILATPCSRQR